MTGSKVLTDLQRTGEHAASENAKLRASAKAAELAVEQIDQARLICSEQKLGTDNDTVLRVAQIIATNLSRLA